jgi:hypothetical protein
MVQKREPWNPLLKSLVDDKRLNSMSTDAQNLYFRLTASTDDNGNFEGDPVLVLCGLFKIMFRDGRIDDKKVSRLIKENIDAGMVCIYKNSGMKYIHVNQSKKHVRRDIKPDIRFPVYRKKDVTAGVPDAVPDTKQIRPDFVATSTTTTTTTKDLFSTKERKKKPANPNICVVDRKRAVKHDKKRNGDKVGLCLKCWMSFTKTNKRWGWMNPKKIEQIVLENKAARD